MVPCVFRQARIGCFFRDKSSYARCLRRLRHEGGAPFKNRCSVFWEFFDAWRERHGYFEKCMLVRNFQCLFLPNATMCGKLVERMCKNAVAQKCGLVEAAGLKNHDGKVPNLRSWSRFMAEVCSLPRLATNYCDCCKLRVLELVVILRRS